MAGLIGPRARCGTRDLGYPCWERDADLERLRRDFAHALVIAVGQIKTPEPRMRLFDLLEPHGCALPVDRFAARLRFGHALRGCGHHRHARGDRERGGGRRAKLHHQQQSLDGARYR